jgi:hypothetical protein
VKYKINRSQAFERRASNYSGVMLQEPGEFTSFLIGYFLTGLDERIEVKLPQTERTFVLLGSLEKDNLSIFGID